MSTTHADEALRLVVVTPGTDSGRQVEVAGNGTELVVGRAPDCDLRLDDAHVSRRHAVLVRRGSTLYVHDLGSTCGTFVNGIRVAGPHVLWPGDVVSFAGVDARLGPELGGPDASRDGRTPTRERSVSYQVGSQHAGTVNNVARDQHNSYVAHVVQERDSFLRQVAATRTKARWLVWTGLLMYVAGVLLFATGPLGGIRDAQQAAETGATTTPQFFTTYALVGWFLGFLGTVLLVVGIVLHVVAAARRRRIETQFASQALPSWGG
jgi:hypothetical protein